MKKQTLIILFFLLTGIGFQHVNAQDLLGNLYGKWNITKYQSKTKTQLRNGTLDFQSDGSFLSEGIYFGTKKGLYTTDETRSVVIIEIDEAKTEWVASFKKGMLRLHTAPGSRQPKVYMTLARIEPDVITDKKNLKK